MRKNDKIEPESKVANFIGTALIIICIPLLIIVLTIAIKANINHEHLPDFLGYKPLICASNSMGNVFQVGDITISKEVTEDELKKGDIIAFWDKSHTTVIVHRIEAIELDENNKKTYITKGDMNNSIDDKEVEFSQIEGKYVGHIKYIGYIILQLQKPTGLIIGFLIPILIMVLVYKYKLIVKETKTKRKEKLLKRIEQKQSNSSR